MEQLLKARYFSQFLENNSKNAIIHQLLEKCESDYKNNVLQVYLTERAYSIINCKPKKDIIRGVKDVQVALVFTGDSRFLMLIPPDIA